MKNSVKILLMVFVVVLFTGIIGQKVQASDITLKSGKWTEGILLETGTDQYYKINVKKSGYIKIEYKRDDEFSDAAYDVYYKGKKQKVASVGFLTEGSSTSYLAVKKGTYYIHINDCAYSEGGDLLDIDSDDTETIRTESYKIRYSFKSMKEGKKVQQYKKAPSLKKNKTVSGLFYTKNKMQKSYYKITVSKKQKITFDYQIMSTSPSAGTLDLYNKNGKHLNVNKKHQVKTGGGTCWEGKGSDYIILDKGTYYFCFWMAPGESGYYNLKIK